ncbi:MAG: asparagine synthase (glutamine-hydrolyzing) [Chitinophagaceae bacterium]|nr:asparagine synthase (glutamine-hydrolyzing) [Chitinophagaceae bacterium]
MCGIAGIIVSRSSGQSNLNADELNHSLKKMTGALAHRGPDSEGYWMNENNTAALGHRRLAIIDLSGAAAQPMDYLNRYSIVHNGEIYNYTELRATLQAKGYIFRSQSDTEVILASFDFWKTDCLSHFDGMFAFAIWDETKKQLFCARDRFGEKPFFYALNESSNTFSFASEMKALWASGFPKEMDNQMLFHFLSLGLTCDSLQLSRTFYKNIFRLPPAHFLIYHAAEGHAIVEKYWDLDKEKQIEIKETDAIEKFSDLLNTSVKRRLRSDVPHGTSLSGGLDSTSVAAVISEQQMTGSRLQSFSAVFPGFEKDESEYVMLAAGKLLLNVHTVSANATDCVNDFEKLCYHQEEPFTSASAYAQFKVFELAKQKGVKVLLDGQGADEILAGYHKYIHWYLQELLGARRFSLMRKERTALKKNHISFRWGMENYLAAWLPGMAARQLEKKAYAIQLRQPDLEKQFIYTHLEKNSIYKPVTDKLNDVLYFDTMMGRLQELLRYADRSSMAHGREVRLPFTFHELVEFVFSLPASFKIRNGWTKWLLREAMKNKIPPQVAWRTDKIGFEPPQQQWMSHSSMQELIIEAKRKLVNHKILKPETLTKKNQPQAAYAADNYDWRYGVAAQFI